MNSGEFLLTSHLSEAEHRPLSSSEWQMRIRNPVVQPASRFLPITVSDGLHRGAIRPKSVCDYDLRLSVPLHCFPEEIQRCFAITALRDITFQHFAFVIHSTPQVVRLAVDLHENRIKMPLPV